MKLNTLIIGSGGREHAICRSIVKSPLSKNVFVLPGNPGTDKIANNINIPIDRYPKDDSRERNRYFSLRP